MIARAGSIGMKPRRNMTNLMISLTKIRPMKGKRTNKTTRDSSLEINDIITKKILYSKNTWTKWNHEIESNTMILKTKGNCVLAFVFFDDVVFAIT